jgi:hypothetical protein
MKTNIHNFIFLCGLRDFHAMDWLRSFEKNYPHCRYVIICDSIEAEGEKSLIDNHDLVEKLIIIDRLLFKSKNKFSNLFRNIIKLVLTPIQLLILYFKVKKYNNPVVFANGAYFVFLLSFLNIKFIANPIGSEILIRPFESRLYKYFLKRSLQKSSLITLDSYKMQSVLKELFNLDSVVIQNGIDLSKILIFKNIVSQDKKYNLRSQYTSIRAITPLYNIDKIILARNSSIYKNLKIDFIYPFFDLKFKNKWFKILSIGDSDLGRLEDVMYYKQLSISRVVFSVPSSDASPKSVYESIFLGCVVVVKKLEFLEMLPKAMRDRIVVVDFDNFNWFEDAIMKAEIILKEDFIPDDESLEFVNRDISVFKLFKLINKVYE